MTTKLEQNEKNLEQTKFLHEIGADCFDEKFDLLRRMLSSEDPSVLIGNMKTDDFVKMALDCFVEYKKEVHERKKEQEISVKNSQYGGFLSQLIILFINEKISLAKFKESFKKFKEILSFSLDHQKENKKDLSQLLSKIIN